MTVHRAWRFCHELARLWSADQPLSSHRCVRRLRIFGQRDKL